MLSMLASPPVATPESFPPCTESSCEASAVRRASACHTKSSSASEPVTMSASRASMRTMSTRKKLAVTKSSATVARSAEITSAARSFSSTRAAISPGERCE